MSGPLRRGPFSSGECKLGLALSGGGFRAALFHLGVLARLAELDLLGKIEVISAVSGGSIVGAAYYLMLKQLMERPTAPTPADRLELVRRLEVSFLKGVQTNPRTRVLTNPLHNLRMLLTDYSRTERMTHLYNQHFYRTIWHEITGKEASAVPLQDIKITPPGYANRDSYNASHTYKIPMLVINATTLNTGKNFRFTASEVGDPDLGFIRFDTVADLVALRRWLKNPTPSAPPPGFSPAEQELALAISSRAANGWGPLCALLGPEGIKLLRETPLSALYRWKNLAWTATHDSGVAGEQARAELCADLARQDLAPDPLLAGLRGLEIKLDELFHQVYLVRLARQVRDECAEDMRRLSLERAVAASAAVPGVFEPIVFRDLYDDAAVEVVRLADGGVYDNQGLAALFEERCTHIICSDASGQLVFERDVAGKITGLLARANEVLMEKIRWDGLQFLSRAHETTEALGTLEAQGCISGRAGCDQPLEDLYGLNHVKQTAFFHLRSSFQATGLPAPSGELQEAISEIRTDLDSFTDAEAYTLMYDGYYLASHSLIPQWFSDFVPTGTKPQPPPPGRWSFYPPPLVDKPDLLHHIRVASHRLFKVFRLWSIWGALAWLAAVGIFVLLAYLFPLVTLNHLLVWPLQLFGYNEPVTVGSLLPFRDRLIALFPRLKGIVEFSLLPLGDLFNVPIHVPSIALVTIAIYVAYRLWSRIKARLLKRDWPRLWSLVRFFIRWKRSPIFPIAVVWAVIAAIAARVHLWLFDWLFLKAGRVR